MNKDVIYIEPEDDITDIISKLKQANEKVVALVPPKKIGVLRSAVNTKLVAKAAKEADKVAVLVTVDPALIKLAAAADLPIAKTLQSKPMMPSEVDFDPADDQNVEIIDETAGQTPAAPVNTEPDQIIESAEIEDELEDSADPAAKTDKTKPNKADKKSAKDKKSGKIPDLKKYRKWIILGVIAFIGLIGFLIWAMFFAPAAKITVAVRTTADNFSETITFVTNDKSADPSKGIFLLEEKSYEDKKSVDFSATGTKDVGEKASGTLTLTATLKMPVKELPVPAGSTFTYNGLQYTTNRSISFKIDAAEDGRCGVSTYTSTGCKISATVSATAAAAGAKYNISAHSSGWTSNISGVQAANDPFSGGTDKTITIVQQSDVDKAKNDLAASNEAEGKKKLMKKFSDDFVVIESSFSQDSGEPQVSPKVGEEAAEGKAKIEITTTYKMYGVDKDQLEDYIKSKASKKLADDQKIYAVDTPFFDRFSQSDGGGYTAKLKTTTRSGPKVTEKDILEKSQGKKIGEVQSLIKSINGVSSVDIEPSFFWVGKIPNDPNKINIELTVEE